MTGRHMCLARRAGGSMTCTRCDTIYGLKARNRTSFERETCECVEDVLGARCGGAVRRPAVELANIFLAKLAVGDALYQHSMQVCNSLVFSLRGYVVNEMRGVARHHTNHTNNTFSALSPLPACSPAWRSARALSTSVALSHSTRDAENRSWKRSAAPAVRRPET